MNILKILDKMLIEYHYWKKYGIFPEDDYTEKVIEVSPYQLCVQGGKGNQTLWTWKKTETEKIYPERYYIDYKNKIELL